MVTDTQDVRAIFLDALEFASAQQATDFVRTTCHDARARDRVLQLLDAHFEAGPFLGGLRPGEAHVEQIGPYRLLYPIGQGGMGIVWLAEQREPVERRVALKLIRPDIQGPELVGYFHEEQQTLATMSHPNIPRILDAGATDAGQPYFVMELVDAVTITRYCDDHRLTLRQRLGLFRTVCQAVQHAHQKGIIHRDLKPANVLVGLCDGSPRVNVIDFGVARSVILEDSNPEQAPPPECPVGTPSYMSPEQAGVIAAGVDTRSDVYALGALLFELLAGSPPLPRATIERQGGLPALKEHFAADPPLPSQRIVASVASRTKTSPRKTDRCDEPTLAAPEAAPAAIQQPSAGQPIRDPREAPADPDEPSGTGGVTGAEIAVARSVEPRRLVRLLQGELDAIVAKCLQRDPEGRYESAGELAKDIGHYLDGRPVSPCGQSFLYVAGKFLSRHRAMCAASALIVLLLAGGLVGTSVALRYVSKAYRELAAISATLRCQLYCADVALAMDAWRENDLARMESLLDRHVPVRGQDEEDLRSFDWYLLRRLVTAAETRSLGESLEAESGAFSPDGRWIAIGLGSGPVKLYEAQSLREVKTYGEMLAGPDHRAGVTFTHDGRLVFLNGDRVVMVDPDEPESQKIELKPPDGLFSPDGLLSLAVSADASRVAAGTLSGEILVWDLRPDASQPVRQLEFGAAVHCLAFAHHRPLLAASGSGLPVRFWKLDQDAPPVLIDSPWRVWTGPIAFSPDDRRLACAASEKLLWWDLHSGQPSATMLHASPVWGLDFSPDGLQIATVTRRGMLHVWDANRCVSLRQIPADCANSHSVRFSADGEQLLTVGGGKGFHLWPATFQPGVERHPIGAGVRAARVTADGRHVLALCVTSPEDRRLRRWTLPSLAELESPLPGEVSVTAFDLFGDDLIAAGTSSGEVKLRHLAQGNEQTLHGLSEITSPVSAIRFGSDGAMVAIGREDGTLGVWNLQQRAWEHVEAPGSSPWVYALEFLDHGRILAAAQGEQLRLWKRVADSGPHGNLASWEPLRNLSGHERPVRALARHPLDENLLASGGTDRAVKLWRCDRDDSPETLDGHAGPVVSLAFTPDGKVLASGSSEGAIVLWDVATGGQRLRLEPDEALAGSTLAFTPDRRGLLCGGASKSLYLWQAATSSSP